jgi:hypothetical protein
MPRRADVPRATAKASSSGSEVFFVVRPRPSEPAFLQNVFDPMGEHPPHLMEYAVQIAWNYLEKTGQIDDGGFTSQFLMQNVEEMIRKGERRRLMLSNCAITAYERLRRNRNKEVAT